jgi:hypothetical protein
MTPRAKGASSRVRVAALLLIVGLLAGPAGTHLYWALGGTWGLHQSTSTGIRVVAIVVIVLLVAAVLVVLAQVGLWQPAFVSDRVIRFSRGRWREPSWSRRWPPSPGAGASLSGGCTGRSRS